MLPSGPTAPPVIQRAPCSEEWESAPAVVVPLLGTE
jgi:hypothetical protein